MGGTAADTAVVPPVRSLATSRYLAAVLLRFDSAFQRPL